MGFALLLTLWALMLVTGTTLFLVWRTVWQSEQQRWSDRQQSMDLLQEDNQDSQQETTRYHYDDYITALERQILENNQDVSLLGQQLTEARDQLAKTLADQTQDSLDPDLLQVIATLKSRVRTRDQQITALHMDLAKFQKHRETLESRDQKINELSSELALIEGELNILRARVASSKR